MMQFFLEKHGMEHLEGRRKGRRRTLEQQARQQMGGKPAFDPFIQRNITKMM
jgi:hypothetical protein